MDENVKQLILDYQEIFGSEAGQRVHCDLSEKLNYDASFAVAISSGNSDNVLMELGKREAFLYIMDMIKADPNAQVQENYSANLPGVEELRKCETSNLVKQGTYE